MKDTTLKKLTRILSYLLVAVLASVVTMMAFVPQDGRQNDSKLEELGDLIEERFIGEADRTAMEDAAAAAMVDSLGDRWSYYIPAAEYAYYMEQMNNSYVGIGITIQMTEDQSGVRVTKVNEGGPAQEAGIQTGDVITVVEGQDIGRMEIDEIRNLVRGEANTELTLSVRRENKKLDFTVSRRQVRTEVATSRMLEDDIGLVSILNFDSRCYDETIAAIENLLQQGARALVFDVRFNPGGYKDELVKILDYLLPEGPLFRSEDYRGHTAVDKSDADFLDIPMAVLVNGESYSAAEFFAAALREYEAAVVVGQQTVGKGYFQTTMTLQDGSAVGLSIGKYFTPQGVSLAGVGITPDIVIPVDEKTMGDIYAGLLPAEEDPQIQAAVEALKVN